MATILSDNTIILHELQVSEHYRGTRLDKFIAGEVPTLSRSKVKQLIENGYVSCDTHIILDSDYKVLANQCVKVEEHKSPPQPLLPKDLKLKVTFEDEFLAVIDKPAGLTVHPGVSTGDTLVHGLLYHFQKLSQNDAIRPGIVHRLDKDTSGLLLIAKTDQVHASLSAQLQRREIRRVYKALVYGIPSPLVGTIKARLGRSKTDIRKFMVVPQGGREAITHYKVLEQFGLQAALLQCTLDTGRTHQIRVHMLYKGTPIIGDPLYYNHTRANLLAKLAPEQAEVLKALSRQALHAWKIAFEHPITKEHLEFVSEMPHDIERVVRAFKS